MNKILIIYLIIVNIVGFALFGIDKRKAVKKRFRIPEATLLGITLIGGSIGTFLGMNVFHHKTMHKKFSVGIPLIFILQICIILCFKTL